jgi:hypothetical protein
MVQQNYLKRRRPDEENDCFSPATTAEKALQRLFLFLRFGRLQSH